MSIRLALVLLSLLALAGCSLPGKPTPADIVHRPSDNLDGVALYKQNCAGCHGAEGKLGPAPPIGDPVYLALIDDNTLRQVISKGRAGTPMSAFAESEGGMLTGKQVDAIVQGMRRQWGKPDVLQGGTAPPYAAKNAGNPQHGVVVFGTYCASCHGSNGAGSDRVGSIVNPQYLSLITDQGLRTITIIGRPDFNAPDWRSNVPGHPMSDQEITDVVAWLAAQRPAGATTSSSASNQGTTARAAGPSSTGSYQGTTSVVPNNAKLNSGFSPCATRGLKPTTKRAAFGTAESRALIQSADDPNCETAGTSASSRRASSSGGHQ